MRACEHVAALSSKLRDTQGSDGQSVSGKPVSTLWQVGKVESCVHIRLSQNTVQSDLKTEMQLDMSQGLSSVSP